MNPIRRVVLGVLAVALFGVILYQLQLPLHQNAGRYGAVFSDIGQDDAAQGGQAPAGVEPLVYRLHFDLDSSRETFSGHTEIDVRLAQAARIIPLHGKRLNVTRARVLTPAGEAIAAHYKEVGPHGDARLVLRKAAPAGVVTLALDYEALFGDAMAGIYRVTAEDASYVFTHFQAMAARQAFPSFDDPRFRTPYHISLMVGAKDMAVSNRPLAVERDMGDGRRLLVFEATSPLPSHLLAFAAGPFDVRGAASLPTTPLRGHGVALRALTASGDAKAAALALTETRDYVPALEAGLGVPYPYSKLDLVAVPGLAAPAAYPGIIFYAADTLLMPPLPQQDSVRQFAEQHAQALAQQWFGNLVAPAGWDQGWLNRALARWLSLRTLQAVHPQLGFEQVVQQGTRAAMTVDAGAAVLPLRGSGTVPVGGHSVFDAFARDKGAAVLTMFEAMVGPEKFHAIVQHYVRTHADGAATVGDFLKSVTEVLAEDVTAAAMRTFLDQPGVPLVTVDWNCAPQGVSVVVAQERYTPLGQPAPTPAVTWGIPVCLRMPSAGGDSATQCMLAARPSQTFYLRQQSCPQAVIPNADGRGYYYWLVSGPNATRLSDMLPRLSPGEVLSYADGLSAAFRAGQLAVTDYMTAIGRLASSPQWEAVVRPLDDLRFLLHYAVPQDVAAKRAAQSAVADLYRPRLELGLQQNAATTGAREVRRRLLEFYVRDLEDPGLVAVLADQGRRVLGRVDAASGKAADMPGLAVSAALMTEGPALVDVIKRRLAQNMDAAGRQAVLSGWALTPRTEVAAAFLQYLADADTPAADVQQGLALIADNPAARPLLWMWLAEHGLQMASRLPDWLKGDVVAVVGAYCDSVRADMAAQSFDRLAAATGEPGRLQSAIQEIRQCAALRNAVAEGVRQAFRLPALPPPPPVEAPAEVDAPASAATGEGAARNSRLTIS